MLKEAVVSSRVTAERLELNRLCLEGKGQHAGGSKTKPKERAA